MLHINDLRADRTRYEQALQKRLPNAGELIHQVLDIDDQRRAAQTELDGQLSELKTLSAKIGQLMKTGQRDQAELLKSQTASLKETIQQLESKMKEAEEQLKELLATIPNAPHESVPMGKSSDDNVTVRSWGDLPQKNVPHWEISDKLGLIDFESGVKITGAGFPVYRGKGAKLQRALIQYFLDKAAEAGYEEIVPPHLVNAESGFATGQLPDKDGQMYYIGQDGLYLIPTAEVPITNLYRDMILSEEDLPVKNAGYTPCFRREAGSYGKDVRGLNRLHQFDKVEIVQVCHPENSYDALEEMLSHAEGLLHELELPYRVVKLCSGDLGFTSAMTYDLEVYAAGQQKWLEVSSVSNFETYQSVRLKLRIKSKDSRNKVFAHTLNGSALALPRVVAALLENNFNGKEVKLPGVLVKYTGFETI
ncbi:MAG: serine--tRNA ligase [Salibacteraceae bacterium]